MKKKDMCFFVTTGSAASKTIPNVTGFSKDGHGGLITGKKNLAFY